MNSQQEENKPSDSKEDISLYQILGVQNTASTQEITKAFRKRAIKEHPDKGGNPEKYRTLTQAYQILKDPEKRDLYDKYGMEGVKRGGDPNGNDFFNMFQSHHSKGPKKCKPKLIQIKISLQKAFFGGEANQSIVRTRICKQCSGKGGQNPIQCSQCGAKGFRQEMIMIGPGICTKRPVPCASCSMQGFIFKQEERCLICQGKRVVEQTKQYKILIEPGIPHQHEIIQNGQADEFPGFQPGDLFFRTLIQPHQFLSRKGADLYLTKQITLLQALCGVTFTQKLIGDEQILVSSIPNDIISNGDKKLVKFKGMPFFKQHSHRGHLVITFKVNMPEYDEIEQKKLFRLSHVIKQPIKYSRQVNGTLVMCQSFQDPSLIREQGDQQEEGVRCQPQ